MSDAIIYHAFAADVRMQSRVCRRMLPIVAHGC